MPLRPNHARRILFTLVACVALLAIPTVASANKNLSVGFLDNAYAGAQPTAFWSDAVALNVGFMRWDVQWSEIAPTKPTNPRDPADPAYDFGATDQFMRSAAAHGLQNKVMFTLWKTPGWATKAKSAKATQMPNLTAWKDFVFACATRYSGTYIPPGATTPLPANVNWETWNEPNASFAFRPQKVGGKVVSPANYVKLLNALKGEVSKVSSKHTFVAGALYKQGGPGGISPINFLRGMKAAHATFNVLSIHPYNNTPRLGLNDGLDQSKTNPNFIGVGNFQTFITLSNQIFGKKYPIWVTEFGWNTPSPGKNQYVASFKQQARFAYESILRFKQLPQVDHIMWFLIKDNEPTVGAWYTTGLRLITGAEKPSYGSWQSAVAQIKKSTIH
jgi:Glycosyl hydrolase catalytic core